MTTNKERKEIHRILRNTIIEPPVFGEWLLGDGHHLAAKLDSLNSYLTRHTPKKLYKMRKCNEKSLNAVREGTLYYSRADFFNDPYDCLLSFDPILLARQIGEQLSYKNVYSYVEKLNLEFPLIFPDGKAFDDIDSFVRFATRKEYFDTLFQNIAEYYPQMVRQLQENTFIVSLTENICSTIMWSHYANDHKGFAIEYEFRPDMFCPAPMIVTDSDYPWHGYRSLLPVLYSDKRIDATDLANWLALCHTSEVFYTFGIEDDLSVFMSDLLMTTKLCLHKSKDWSYEKEWRLMISHNWPYKIDESYIHTDYPASAIYLGERINDGDRSELISAARNLNIPVYEMFIDYTSTSYDLSFQPIQ